MTADAAIVELKAAEQGSSLWRDAWQRLRKNRLAVFGLGVLGLFITIALLTPWIAPYEYAQQNLDLGASAPSVEHWLGTDVFGRDLLTQIMYGGRISLAVGFIATAVALLIGVTWGAVAGYAGGRVDTLMMRLVEGMTGPEIAERTGLTPGSVRVNLHRGMRELRTRLGVEVAP
jgi:oligopeptide transport system permease protein